ncbi:hypothetical protein RhiLY_10083 [Ceratobasidium sp. AG-Ba]|nr:hypothetical protein RhiLY_10083 [Ceratobasidium sp. AG-Ba]
MPATPSARTFDAAWRTPDGVKVFEEPVRSFDVTPSTRHAPPGSTLSRVISRFDTVRHNIPTPPGLARHDTSHVVSYFGTSPARFEPGPTPASYVPPPVPRHDLSPTASRYDPAQINAPEPYADTETDKDVDALSSWLIEDDTAGQADRMNVEVMRDKVAEASLHPFPFSQPTPSHSSNSRAVPSLMSH